jgi:hypothetical protein
LSPPISRIAIRPARVERGEGAIGPSRVLYAQLPHVVVSRPIDPRAGGERESRAPCFEKLDYGGDILLLSLREGVPPVLELVRKLDYPFHGRNITGKE